MDDLSLLQVGYCRRSEVLVVLGENDETELFPPKRLREQADILVAQFPNAFGWRDDVCKPNTKFVIDDHDFALSN